MVGVLACPGFVDSASRASSSISVGVPADFFVISFVVSCVVDMGLEKFRATVVCSRVAVLYAVKL